MYLWKWHFVGPNVSLLLRYIFKKTPFSPHLQLDQTPTQNRRHRRCSPSPPRIQSPRPSPSCSRSLDYVQRQLQPDEPDLAGLCVPDLAGSERRWTARFRERVASPLGTKRRRVPPRRHAPG
jgi:hypothetical protein